MSVRLPHTIATMTGDFDYEAPVIDLEDVAVGLSRECRFGRFTQRWYSVAEHSLLVAAIVYERLPELALAALWHDAHEAYMGDVPTPLKAILGDGWHKVADRIDVAVAEYLGLDSVVVLHHPIIKWADRTAMLYEASILKPGEGWAFTRALDHGVAERAAREWSLPLDLPPRTAVAEFIYRHGRLSS